MNDQCDRCLKVACCPLYPHAVSNSIECVEFVSVEDIKVPGELSEEMKQEDS